MFDCFYFMIKMRGKGELSRLGKGLKLILVELNVINDFIGLFVSDFLIYILVVYFILYIINIYK